MRPHDEDLNNAPGQGQGTSNGQANSPSPPARKPLWWRVAEWLPAKVFTPCATCMFWRGALAGAIIAVVVLASLGRLH